MRPVQAMVRTVSNMAFAPMKFVGEWPERCPLLKVFLIIRLDEFRESRDELQVHGKTAAWGHGSNLDPEFLDFEEYGQSGIQPLIPVPKRTPDKQSENPDE